MESGESSGMGGIGGGSDWKANPTESDFVERIAVLKNLRAEREKKFEKRPKLFLLVLSAVYFVFALLQYDRYRGINPEWGMDYLIIPGAVFGLIVILGVLFIPAAFRGYSGSIFALWAISIYLIDHIAGMLCDVSLLNELQNIITENPLSLLEYFAVLMLFPIIYGLSRCAETWHANKTLRYFCIGFGCFSIIVNSYEFLFYSPGNFETVAFVGGICLSALLMVFYLLLSSKKLNTALFTMKIVRMAALTVLILCGLFESELFEIWSWVKSIMYEREYYSLRVNGIGVLTYLLAIFFMADFIGAIFFRPWKKNADIEISRMEQELAGMREEK
jgi:hypothetical protein